VGTGLVHLVTTLQRGSREGNGEGRLFPPGPPRSGLSPWKTSEILDAKSDLFIAYFVYQLLGE